MAVWQESGAAESSLQARLLNEPMSSTQWLGIAVTVALCALDGFDVLAITFAAPAIARSWGIDKSQVGFVFSAGLLGMALGSFFLAPAADRYGRRTLVLLSLAIMVSGTLWTGASASLQSLVFSRLYTGLGIGAMIAVINPLAAEYANARRRDVAMSLVNVGFPIGGVVGGMIAAIALPIYGWRALFWGASVLGTVAALLVLIALPEPATTIAVRGGPNALARVNAYLRRCGRRPVESLDGVSKLTGTPIVALFCGELAPVTLAITAIYLLFVMTMFFMQSWLPTLVADLGLAAGPAAGIAVWLSIGGIAGGLVLGMAAMRFGLKPVVLAALFMATAVVAMFGFVPANPVLLKLAAAVAGFAVFGGMIGLYAVVSRSFPVAVRASGTGFAIGIGRLGSAFPPLLAGGLLAGGFGRIGVCVLMALPALLAGLLLIRFHIRAVATL